MTALFSFLFRQSVFFNLLFTGVMAYGIFISIPQIPVDRYPNINFGEVVISTSYPGASSQDVERLVTEEIEESLKGMDNIEFIRSSSKNGFSTINIKFIDDTDYDRLYDELRLRVLGIQNRLPSIQGKPLTPDFNVTKVDDWLPVFQLNLVSSRPEAPISKRALGRLAEELQLSLDNIPDVQEVKLNGRDQLQMTLALDPQKVQKNNLNLKEVQAALALAGGSTPGGTIDILNREHIILLDDRFRKQQDLYGIVIRRGSHGKHITLGDVIDYSKSGLMRVSGGVISSVNGLDTVSCQIVKSPNGNAKKIKAEVLKVAETFLEAHSDLDIDIVTTLDSTVKIDDGLGVLQNSLGMAMVLVMLAIFLFLSTSSRKMVTLVCATSVTALIVMIRFNDDSSLTLLALALNTLLVFFTCQAAVLSVSGIAFSFVGCLLLFQVLGTSLNEITLLGFVLTSGIIVDDAIVVLENIQRHRERGMNIFDAAVLGTSEVFWPVISASLTTVAAFLPMLIMTGSVGEFFSLIPITVAAALAISLIECLTIMPLHAIELERLSQWFSQKKNTPEPFDSKEKSRDQVQLNEFQADEVGLSESEKQAPSKLLNRMTHLYDNSLNWCLNHPFLSLLSVAFLFLLSIGVLIQSALGPLNGQPALLKLKFFPDDTSNIQIIVDMPSQTTHEKTDEFVRQLSTHLMGKGPGYIKSVSANAGLSIDSSYKPIFGSHLAFMIVELPSRKDRAFGNAIRYIDEVRNELEERFEKDGINLDISAQKDGPPVGAPLHIRVAGVSEPNVVKLGQDLFEYIQQQEQGDFKGLRDLKSDRQNFSTTFHFQTNQRKAADRHLSARDVQFFTGTLFEGSYIGDMRLEDEEVPIMLKLSHPAQAPMETLLQLPISQNHQESITFADVGQYRTLMNPSSLERRDHQRIINITSNIREGSLLQAPDFQKLIEAWYDDRRQEYPGANLAFGGESESTAKSYQSLISAFLVSIFLIYGILSVQFKSYTQPLLIMVNILFSFTGVVLMTGLLGLFIIILPDGAISSQRAMITVQSFIAVIGLTGLVVNDAIVLIDFINQERKRGRSLTDAVKRGAHHRVRPIIMTTWSTIAGLLPLAIGIPSFSITWGPFATCFVAGLSMSTLMTLLIIPVLYHMLEGFKEKLFSNPEQTQQKQLSPS
jgi:HAE1 family hydrophobic/amphiphilic exporter-1